MKKSKFIKSLVALAVSIVAALGCIGLVACGGGDPEVNSVSLNKTTLSLAVGANETLVATTDPADATVTWSTSAEATATVDQTGKVTAVAAGTAVITAKAGEKTATCNVTVTAAQQGGGNEGGGNQDPPAAKLGGTFSWDALKDAMAEDPDVATANPDFATYPDNTVLKAEYFTGDNAFLTLTESSSNKIRGPQWDAANNKVKNADLKCVEIKDGALSVTFTGTGTLTISFSSTGKNNISGLALKNEAGTCLTGTLGELASNVTVNLIDSTDELNAGFYQISSTEKATAATITFNITEAGTYTIWGGKYVADSSKENGINNERGTRIHSIVMVDNGAQA